MHFYGIYDEEFIRGKVPMTKREVRMMVMAQAQIQSGDVVVDIGAGTGSLSIEAAFEAQTVYAVERNEEAVELIAKNREKFGLSNIHIIKAKAPEGLDVIEKANVILIGGSGGKLPEILDEAERMLPAWGRIVITAVTVETMNQALQELRKRPFVYEGFQMQVNRMRKAGPYHLYDPLSPIGIITAVKQKQEGK